MIGCLSYILETSYIIANCTSGKTGVSIRFYILCTIDWEIFAHKNICLLNFRIVLFSSPRHTGSVASFLLFDVEKHFNFHRRRVLTKNY